MQFGVDIAQQCGDSGSALRVLALQQTQRSLVSGVLELQLRHQCAALLAQLTQTLLARLGLLAARMFDQGVIGAAACTLCLCELFTSVVELTAKSERYGGIASGFGSGELHVQIASEAGQRVFVLATTLYLIGRIHGLPPRASSSARAADNGLASSPGVGRPIFALSSARCSSRARNAVDSSASESLAIAARVPGSVQ